MRADDRVQDRLCSRVRIVHSWGNAEDAASDVPPTRRATRVRDPRTVRTRRNGARSTLLRTRRCLPDAQACVAEL